MAALTAVTDEFRATGSSLLWPALLMDLVATPPGLWVFGQDNNDAKRTGKLDRNG